MTELEPPLPKGEADDESIANATQNFRDFLNGSSQNAELSVEGDFFERYIELWEACGRDDKIVSGIISSCIEGEEI